MIKTSSDLLRSSSAIFDLQFCPHSCSPFQNCFWFCIFFFFFFHFHLLLFSQPGLFFSFPGLIASRNTLPLPHNWISASRSLFFWHSVHTWFQTEYDWGISDRWCILTIIIQISTPWLWQSQKPTCKPWQDQEQADLHEHTPSLEQWTQHLKTQGLGNVEL